MILHEADEPNAGVDFFYAEFWAAMTDEMLIFFRCMQMRPQLVTSTSRPWKEYSTSGRPL